MLCPLHFIGEPIGVEFDEPPALEKKPGCPARFVWREQPHTVAETLSEWFDFARKGRAAKNMRPSHAALASVRGSWGAGRYYFQIRTSDNRYFELYYDRAPKDSDHRKGAWFLVSELQVKMTNEK